MKKIVAIILLTTYLFSATDLKELLKINVVIEHLHEHQKNDHSVTLFQFLVMHYLTEDYNDNDNNRDCKLPFKSPESNIQEISFASLTDPFSTSCFNLFITNTGMLFIKYYFFIPPACYTNIWHPPQLS